MEDKITIIVPVYNAEYTLRRCVESIIRQTYTNIEIILVNDGSKDNSLEICKDYEQRDSRIIVIDKENGGVSTARNAGLKHATGSLIAFCDSDDWVEDTWIEVLHNHYKPNSLVMCGYICHKKNGEVGKIGISKDIEEIACKDYLTTKLIGGFVPWNKLYEREIIETYDIQFPQGITLGEDKLFIWRYLNKINGNIICIRAYLNDYNWPEDNSLTVNLPDNYYSQCFSIYTEIKQDIANGTRCSELALKALSNDTYLQLERAIRTIFNSHLSWPEKIKRANTIMQDNIYQECAQAADISSNSLARFLCRKSNCYGVLFLYLIHKY